MQQLRKMMRAVLVAGIAGALSHAVPASAQAEPPARPNILYIMLDDWGYYEMSALGHPILETPHMDRLMSAGVRFTQLLAGGAVCAPTRCAFMTGRHPGHMSVRNNGVTISIRPGEPTVASILKKVGYACGGFGKWGMGARGSEGVPEKHGFDLFFGYYDQTHAHSYYPRYLICNGEAVALAGNNGRSGPHYSQYEVFERAKQFIRDNRDRPFFCYCPWTVPHGNFEIPPSDPSWKRYEGKPWAQNPKARARAAMIHLADRQIGELVELLRELDLAEKTLVLVTGDNGGYEAFRSKEHPRGLFAPNVDPRTGRAFRGHKGSFYEGGLRVPAFACWPGVIQPGRVSGLLCTFTDLMPTLAELAGAKTPPVADGLSIAPTLLDRPGQRQHEWLYWGRGPRAGAVRLGPWKGVHRGARGAWELYDLSEDPGEQHDLAAEHPDRVERMKTIEAQAYTPMRPGRVLDRALLMKDRNSNSPKWKGRIGSDSPQRAAGKDPGGSAAQRPQEAPRLPPPGELLAHLAPEHPRLLLDAGRLERLRKEVDGDEFSMGARAHLRARAERILSQPARSYEIPDGLRLLATSRAVLGRVSTLALVYLLDGEPRFAERAWKELEAAARFPDWNPRHFLDTAEMTAAFALGYDWLYAYWSRERRELLVRAIAAKGLEPAMRAYRGEASWGWWTSAAHNWNQVCNGGIALGALAIAEERPELCARSLREALAHLPRAMARFAPDGAWDEGPGYWNYATRYNTLILAALATALGRDFGLSEAPGYAATGLFPLHLCGPSGRCFNFADCSAKRLCAPQLLWMARRYDRPVLAHHQVRNAEPSALDLIWYDPAIARKSAPALPLDRYFRGVEVATFRSSWEDPRALFLAIKGGCNSVNHGHLDLGSFVLEFGGERFAIDLGADDYNLPGYWNRGPGGRRWSYYRMRAEGHNTLVLNPGKGEDQIVTARAPIVRFASRPGRGFAIIDLSAAYEGRAARVQRGAALIERRQVLVQDEIEASTPLELWWFLHTKASISIAPSGDEAVLELRRAALRARILAPAGARFQRLAATPLPGSPAPAKQRENRGVNKLAIHLPAVKSLRLAVLLEPCAPASQPAPALKALSAW